MGFGGLKKAVATYCIQFTVFLFFLTCLKNYEALAVPPMIFNLSFFTVLVILFFISTKIQGGGFLQFMLFYVSGIVTILDNYLEPVAIFLFIVAFLLLFINGYLQENFAIKFALFLFVIFITILITIVLNNGLATGWGYLLGYCGMVATLIRIVHAIVKRLVAKNSQYLEQCITIYKIASDVTTDSEHKKELLKANIALQKIIGEDQGGINQGRDE